MSGVFENPTHTCTGLIMIERNRAIPTAEPNLDSAEYVKRLADMFMRRSRTARVEFYTEFQKICQTGSWLTALKGATPMREMSEWDDTIESEDNDRYSLTSQQIFLMFRSAKLELQAGRLLWN